MSDAYQWYKIADSTEDLRLSADGLAKIQVAEKELCIAMHNGELFVCAAKCPHAGGDLSEGYVDVSVNIVCPVHCYKFSLKTGRNVSGEGYFVKTYPVKQTPEGIYVRLAELKN